MTVSTPYKEAVDVVKEAGGDPLELCYQCGLCTAACPWNLVRSFLVRKLMHQSQLGLVDFESDDVWTCAACGACVDRCPRGVEIIDVMRAIRRTVVGLGVGKTPESLRIALKSIATLGNPLGEAREKRAEWSQAQGVKRFAAGMEALYFPCCFIAYDPSTRRVGEATVKVLQAAGVDFGTLGTAEFCCGESARKAGNEEIFQAAVAENMSAFRENSVRTVVVSSPHCYYTFKNEYPQGEFEVLHMSQFVAGLLKDGRLKLSKEVNRKVTYHDPCFLGRHSHVFDEPREVLSSIPGLELVEMPFNRENSLCCGGGGGRIWMETPVDERYANDRIGQAVEVGAESMALACPYCLQMFESSVQTTNGGAPRFQDITELVAEAL
jgi:Fe-S oxidoreductase